MLQNTKDNMKILHPSAKSQRNSTDVDTNPKAYYFHQALNGVYTRQLLFLKYWVLNN